MTLDRRHLRTHFRAMRRELPAANRASFERDIANTLTSFAPVADARSVAVYMATDGEVDLTAWIEVARNEDKTLALPCIEEDKTLSFRLFEDGANLTPNRYGIPEPSEGAIVTALDCVLVPLVAYDGRGTRLGMGGGYYDRSFAETRATLVGIAFSCQRSASAIPTEPWDVSLDAIVTELGAAEF